MTRGIMKALVVGLGIGQVYVEQLTQRGFEVITVDSNPNKNADYQTIQEIPADLKFEISIIATPNFLHFGMANQIAPRSNVVLVEKPGFRNVSELQEMKKRYPKTCFFVVKNNLFRDDLTEFIKSICENWNSYYRVDIRWENTKRIPSPGGWFTNKKFSWGGVHRDLMPHLINELQVFCSNLFETKLIPGRAHCLRGQRYTLEEARNLSEYGEINLNSDAVYDVDDWAAILFSHQGVGIVVYADWATQKDSFIGVRAFKNNGDIEEFELGLCPNECYGLMIDHMLEATHNQIIRLWHEHIDLEMHQMLEKFVNVELSGSE